jgi:hydrogenase/urease accessory protein HupE
VDTALAGKLIMTMGDRRRGNGMTSSQFNIRKGQLAVATLILLLAAVFPSSVSAHLLANSAMDVVVCKDRVVIDARISMTQVLVIEANGDDSPDRWPALIDAHRAYLLSHLKMIADGKVLSAVPNPLDQQLGTPVKLGGDSIMAGYHIEYPILAPPQQVRIEQTCLKEFEPSDAALVLRIRQADQSEFQTAELHRDGHAEFDCQWQSGTEAVNASGTQIRFWATVRSFMSQGIWHILTGYDHLLFVSGLVLAATSLWDLVKIVFAFTLAHSITLTLSVLGIFSLNERIVEPMISASIMLVALQNIFMLKRSNGWPRLAVAFSFGLFHGLGFAGGLKDAMSELPSMGLWTALISFSIGVEIGHQTVVLPLYAALTQWRKYRSFQPSILPNIPIVRLGSCVICIAGGYFLVQALRM